MTEKLPDLMGYINEARLIDDDFMNMCLNGNIPCASAMLRHILSRDVRITGVETQKEFRGVKRSLRLDIYATDGRYTVYNIETENKKKRAIPKRARFHCGMIDVNNLDKGQDFSRLPESWVIFITRHDIFGYGRTMYTINRYIEGINEPFGDGQHIIYVNCSAENDGSEVWRLIHDMMCKNPDEMLIPELAERVRYFKAPQEGGSKMATMDEYFKDYIREREQEAAAKAATAAAATATASLLSTFVKAGAMTAEKIAETLGMSTSEVQALIAQARP